jgi:hypothetical protein
MCRENPSVIKISGYFTISPIHTFTIFCPVLLKKIEMFQTKAVETKHILSSFSNRAVYVIMGKNIVQLNRPQMTIWRTRIAG